MAPIILTFVLGRLMETSLLQSLRIFNGNMLEIFLRPIAGTLFGIALVIMIISIVSALKKRRTILASDVEM